LSAAAEGSEYYAGTQTLRLGEDNRGFGWMVFAGALLLILGCTNIIEGIAAVSGSHFFAANAHYLIGDLNSWGWVVWLVGIAQGLTAVALLVKNQFARWLGVVFACLNALAQLLMIQAYPFWSLALLAWTSSSSTGSSSTAVVPTVPPEPQDSFTRSGRCARGFRAETRFMSGQKPAAPLS
jgi:hypothetical protein